MFDSSIKFKYSWRPYQARTLEQIQRYIRDKKVHIVAAPGSGKTVLGLELARFLNQPVIMFSPTVTIKNQWIDRFMTSFTDFEEEPDWISRNIYDIRFFNVATYQALHYAYKRRKFKNDVDPDETDDPVEDIDNQISDEAVDAYDIVSELKNKNVKTVILDEAHHLKAEWWNSLKEVLNQLEDITVISLTATPPYDSDLGEWKKYISLCGEIDAEINVPELVKAKNLCPHQDYIYFNYPTPEDEQKISEYNTNLIRAVEEIQNDNRFLDMIKSHPFIQSPNTNEEDLLDNVDFYSSMLIYLNFRGIPLSKAHLDIIGAKKTIPTQTLAWFEILCKNILQTRRKDFEKDETYIEELEDKFKAIGAYEKRVLSFSDNKTLQKYFLNSIGKLNSISDILRLEYKSLKENLRMVVLTDFIRKEYMKENEIETDKLGVLPIFKKLYTDFPNINMAILTGTLFVIPASLEENLKQLATMQKLDSEKINFEKLAVNANYSEVKIPNSIRNKVMGLICKLFSDGNINVIVGTKSLLGEGWDEPSINTLVLASFVGSFMLSNQMRGRAIRVNMDPNKTANIWHLVCVTNSTVKDSLINADFDMLKRRFNAFPGLAYNSPMIQAGISRMGNIYPPFNNNKILTINNVMKQKASNRMQMLNDWNTALSKNAVNASALISNVAMPTEKKVSRAWFKDRNSLIYQLVFLLGLHFLTVAYDFPTPLKIAEGALALFTLYTIIKAFFSSPSKRMLKNVAATTLDSLCACNIIKTPRRKVFLTMRVTEDNQISCSIDGATLKEGTIFSTSVKEVFDTTDDQRYIIARTTKRGREIKDYYNVPSALAGNKEMAEVFSKFWHKRIGNHKLIYTRTTEGRKKLLKIRMKNISVFK